MSEPGSRSGDDARDGVIIALAAYLLWGMFPAYFKVIESVAPTEVLVHRIVWAVPFGAFIIMLRKQWGEVRRALTHRKMLLGLTLSALCISVNWLVYIWAVQADRIFETSLGYYINPLMAVLAGVVLLGERLRRPQKAAVLLAFVGVAYLTATGGTFPWVALTIAASFTVYAVIRKKIVVGAMPGLFVETILMFAPAFAWLMYLLARGQASIASEGPLIISMLVAAGPVTVVPLLLFAIAAKRLTLTVIGFMQFLAPTMHFLIGVYYGEKLTLGHAVCFGCIWLAAIVFSVDAIKAGRRKPRQVVPAGA